MNLIINFGNFPHYRKLIHARSVVHFRVNFVYAVLAPRHGRINGNEEELEVQSSSTGRGKTIDKYDVIN